MVSSKHFQTELLGIFMVISLAPNIFLKHQECCRRICYLKHFLKLVYFTLIQLHFVRIFSNTLLSASYAITWKSCHRMRGTGIMSTSVCNSHMHSYTSNKCIRIGMLCNAVCRVPPKQNHSSSHKSYALPRELIRVRIVRSHFGNLVIFQLYYLHVPLTYT